MQFNVIPRTQLIITVLSECLSQLLTSKTSFSDYNYTHEHFELEVWVSILLYMCPLHMLHQMEILINMLKFCHRIKQISRVRDCTVCLVSETRYQKSKLKTCILCFNIFPQGSLPS